MSAEEIKTLDKAIGELSKRWDDLDDYSMNVRSLAKKMEILDQMDLVNIRITWLETIRNHLKASLVAIDPPNAGDRKEVQDALNDLSVHIAKDMKWDAAVKLTKTILAAARTIKTNMENRQRALT